MKDQNMKMYNDITQKLLSQFAADGKSNVVFSPLSVIVLLAMLADATGGQTKAEIVKALGSEADFQEIISWIAEIQKEMMDSGALVSSNAVCVKEDLKNKIAPGYEGHLKDVFDGKLFLAEDMVSAVNEWVNMKTKGMIPQIADESMKSMLACLMNAIAFEAKWGTKYESDDIDYGEFNNSDGTCNEVTMMSSTEWQYIEDKHFRGFTKPYNEVGYSYMALLPKEEESNCLKDAVNKLDLTALYNSRRAEEVHTMIPEYKFEFGNELNDFCKKLGIEKAFSDDADFSPMIDEWLKVEKILHKALVQVDRNGTKAVAVTVAVVCAGCIPDFDYEVVDLDRPFIFAIVHDDTGLPVFVGVVNHLDGGDYEIERFEPEELIFDTVEEERAYMKSLYHKIAERIHPDNSPLYESSEEVRDLFRQAQICYNREDLYRLQIVEHNLNQLLESM